MSSIEQADAAGVVHKIDSRFRLDARLARRFADDTIELSLIGRNIFDNETSEFRPSLGSNSTENFGAERSVIVNLRVDF